MHADVRQMTDFSSLLSRRDVVQTARPFATFRCTEGRRLVTPNPHVQPIHQPVTKFACANLPPVWCAAGC